MSFQACYRKSRSACKRDSYPYIVCKTGSVLLFIYLCQSKEERKQLERKLPLMHLPATRHQLQEMLEYLEPALGLHVDRY